MPGQWNSNKENTQNSRKRKIGSGIPLQTQAQEVVNNVYHYIKGQTPNKTDAYKKTSSATGIELN